MSRFHLPFRTSRQIRQDIEDELAFHLSAAAEAYQRDGATSSEARARAEARLGDGTPLRNSLYRINLRAERDQRIMISLSELRQDLRFSRRRMRHRPFLMSLIVLTLALGTGTVMTFFGAADTILLRPLPVTDPDQVMTLWRVPVASPDTRSGLASGTLMDLAEETRTFAAIAAAEPSSFGVPDADGRVVRSISAARVTEGFFDILRTPARVGRLLAAPDYTPGDQRVVVISHRFWMTRFGGEASAVGTTLPLDGIPHLLVGVLPPDFPLVEGRHLYTPLVVSGPTREDRRSDYYRTFGRLHPGVSVTAGRDELRVLAARSDARIVGSQTPRHLDVIPLDDQMLGDVREGIGLLAAGAVLVLLMVAVSASGLLLAETLDREKELAIRASLGAGQGRIVRQMVTEAMVLSVGAGGLGFALGVLGLKAFQRIAPGGLPRLEELGVDFRLAMITGATILLLFALLAVIPTRLVTRGNRSWALRLQGGGPGHPGRRIRMLLVGAQVMLSTVLLGAGGLLVRSWMALRAEDTGYDARGVVAIEQHEAWSLHPTAAALADFGWHASSSLAEQPGVEEAAVASSLPLAAQIGNEQARLFLAETGVEVSARAVVGSPGLLGLLRIAILGGRGFGPEDRAGGELVAVLSRSAGAILFPDQDPVGKMVSIAYSGPPVLRRIIGVVDEVRFGSPALPAEPAVYLPHAQAPTGSLYYVTRHPRVTPGVVVAMQQAVLDLLPGAALEEAIDLRGLQEEALAPRRFAMLLMASSAMVALTLTAIGLFGILAQSVRARRAELGIRMAVGAWPAALRGMVLREGLRLAGAGLVGGLLVFVLAAGVLRRTLYGVPAHDPVTLAGVALLVMAVTVAASWWPAVQATRVDPLQALRRE